MQRKAFITMKKIMKSKKLLIATCALTLGLYTGSVQAQTSNMTATATVQNVLTLTTPSQLNFGTIVAIADTANTASVAIDTVGNVVTASTGIPAYTVVVDDSAAAAAQITVADGADGALINITIDNVVGPVNGTTVFDLDDFTTSWNGNAANTQVIGTPFIETFSSAFNAGVNTLDIGATITTTTATAGPYTDGTYNGTYDVIISY